VNLPLEVHDVNMVSVATSRARSRPPYHHGNLRNALVEAGVELAREGGPSAIVLREAARRVGVSPNAAYRHFDALPDLVGAVALCALATLARSMEAELARCQPSGDAQQDAMNGLHAVGRGYVNFVLAEPGLFATAFSQHDASMDTEASTGDSGLAAYQLLERSLDELLAVGLLAAADRQAAATTAWAAVHGLSMLLLGPLAAIPADERDAVIEANLDLVGRGLLIRN
jgi:AcrR family transcriptional regulator